jgi:pyruvate formate lyase activating enzyme
MKIAAMHKCSFVDYPGHLAAVVFAPGCNLKCHYCHNPSLLGESARQALIEPQAVLAFLARRHGLLDGLVITGGEPTLQAGLGDFCAAVQNLGLRVKLDTNGTRPSVLAELLARRCVDLPLR